MTPEAIYAHWWLYNDRYTLPFIFPGHTAEDTEQIEARERRDAMAEKYQALTGIHPSTIGKRPYT